MKLSNILIVIASLIVVILICGTRIPDSQIATKKPQPPVPNSNAHGERQFLYAITCDSKTDFLNYFAYVQNQMEGDPPRLTEYNIAWSKRFQTAFEQAKAASDRDFPEILTEIRRSFEKSPNVYELPDYGYAPPYREFR